MLYTCYRCYAPLDQQDPLSIMVQRLGGWLSVHYIYVEYWVPEDRAYMLNLFDLELVRLQQSDYIV